MRGFFTSDDVDVSSGLLKVADGNYAMFMSENLARRALNDLSLYTSRCKVSEIQLSQTKNTMSLPMSVNSPYKEAINIG